MGHWRSWNGPSDLSLIEAKEPGLCISISIPQLSSFIWQSEILGRWGGDSVGNTRGRATFSSISREVGVEDLVYCARNMDRKDSHPISLWTRYYFACELSRGIRLTSGFKSQEHWDTNMTIIYGWNIMLSLFTLSLFTLFASFVYNSVTMCKVLSPKASTGFLPACFVAVYKWHVKPAPTKTKRYATVFEGRHRAFSKGLPQRKRFENAVLPASRMLADAWCLCHPYSS